MAHAVVRGVNDVAPTAPLDVALAHAARLLSAEPELAAEQAREIIAAVGEHPVAVLVSGTCVWDD